MYIATPSDHSLQTLVLPFKVILRKFELFFYVWSEKDALVKWLMKIHSNPPIRYYGFKIWCEKLAIGRHSDSDAIAYRKYLHFEIMSNSAYL